MRKGTRNGRRSRHELAVYLGAIITMKVLYLADQDGLNFDIGRMTVGVVCAGDSITGWNNYGPVEYWPYLIYPNFLQSACIELDLKVADCGIAG